MKRIRLPASPLNLGSRFQPQLKVIGYTSTRKGDAEQRYNTGEVLAASHILFRVPEKGATPQQVQVLRTRADSLRQVLNVAEQTGKSVGNRLARRGCDCRKSWATETSSFGASSPPNCHQLARKSICKTGNLQIFAPIASCCGRYS